MTAPVDLPPYSGPDPECPKCLFRGARRTYLPLGFCHHDTMELVSTAGGPVNPRLHRECDQCGYTWDEQTADAETVAAVAG